ncbi:MAG: RNA methyltransferase [Nitrospiraceae bacterium]|nr:RNA methyltransferase [Nitrospiraceae bacterium]
MKTLRITSISNPHVKEVLSAVREESSGGERLFLIEGIHLVEMALLSGAAMKEVFFTGPFDEKDEGARLLNSLGERGVALAEVGEQVMSKLTATKTPQGIAALVSHKPAPLSDLKTGGKPLLVILDRIQDPGNLGTIIRTADAAGADAVVILPSSCDPFSGKAVRSTAGSIFHIPIIRNSFDDLRVFLDKRKIRIAVAAADAPSSLYDTVLAGPVALVFGNEAQGVSREVRESADLSFSIPILGRAESLNVASAAAVCLYEAVRQRSAKNSSIRENLQ